MGQIPIVLECSARPAYFNPFLLDTHDIFGYMLNQTRIWSWKIYFFRYQFVDNIGNFRKIFFEQDLSHDENWISIQGHPESV